MKKKFYTLMFTLMLISTSLFAQKKEIIVVCNANDRDSLMVRAITNFTNGSDTVYHVTKITTTKITRAMLPQLNAASAVIMGRSISSFDIRDAMGVWDSITKPVISSTIFGIKSDRAKWINTPNVTYVNKIDTVLKAVIMAPSDPVFAGLSNDTIDWWTSHFVIFTPIDAGNGTLLAETTDGRPLFIRWAAGTEFYTGAGHIPLAERTYIGIGQDSYQPFDYWNFTDAVKTVFFKELERMTNSVVTGIEIHNTYSQLKVYTLDGYISVSAADNLKRVEIYSISGKLLVSTNAKSNYVKLNTSLENGVYVVKAYNLKGKVLTQKILLTR